LSCVVLHGELSDNPKPEYEMAIKALGACLWYLEDSKLDIQVVSMGKFEMYHPLDMNVKETLQRSSMILDSVTMINLNLLGEQGSLQKTVDYCQTAFGKRLLLQWICRPLCNVKQIKERQEAIEELFKNSSLLKEAQDYLKKLPDLERQLAKYMNITFFFGDMLHILLFFVEYILTAIDFLQVIIQIAELFSMRLQLTQKDESMTC
jgi:DNA mismatch repair ATPase MutS